MAEQKKRRGKNAKVVKPDDPIPYGMEVTDMKKKKWKFGNELGSGGCGVIYEGSNGSSSFDFVIKIEHHENGSLYAEMHVYHAIGKQDAINQFVKRKRLNFLGIPVGQGTGSFDYNGKKYRFLVLQRYGKDLQHVLQENNNTLHPKTVFTVGSIVINVLEYIHGLGYVHQDIKAANLMMGNTKDTANHVYLLDMGLATRYISKENVHKSDKPNPGRAHNGTPEFLSRDGHLGVFSRRSDLEILGYNMLFWLSGTLPWINIVDPIKLKQEKIRWMNDVPQLMKCLFPNSNYPELEQYLTYINRLGFEENPQYESCITMFRSALDRLKIKNDGILILKDLNKKPGKDTTLVSDSASSQKENNGKKAERKKRVNRDASTSSSSAVFASGEVLTPAMLDVLTRQQERAAEKAAKKPRKKAV